jgi:hypothetical protein
MHATLLSHWLSRFLFPNCVPPQFFPTLVPRSMSKDIYLSYIKNLSDPSKQSTMKSKFINERYHNQCFLMMNFHFF